MEQEKKRPVNSLLGEKPSLGPIPGDQVIPWSLIAVLSLGLKLFAGLSWTNAGIFLCWGIGCWWLLTGKRSWRFLNRFSRAPRWAKSYRRYNSPFEEDN